MDVKLLCFVKSNLQNPYLNRTCNLCMLLLCLYSEVAILEMYTNPGHSCNVFVCLFFWFSWDSSTDLYLHCHKKYMIFLATCFCVNMHFLSNK